MNNLQLLQLPRDLLEYIFLLNPKTQVKDFAALCKICNQATNQILSLLFRSYVRSQVINPYTISAKTSHIVVPEGKQNQDQYQEIQKVKFVFQEIMKEAEEMGFKNEIHNFETLSVPYLEYVVNWTKEEAHNLSQFASRVPRMAAYFNTIKDLPPLERARAIKKWMEENKENLKRMTKLKLDGLNLTSLPREIKYFTGLRNLNLNGNQLTILPKEIKFLTELQFLYLSRNHLNGLPIEMGYLTQLQYLYLSDNDFTTPPDEVQSLAQLRQLNLCNNKIPDFPANFAHLSHRGGGQYLP